MAATVLVLCAALALSPADAARGPSGEPLLLGQAYPLEVGICFPFALLHWLDSLAGLEGAGLTAGKTVDAHREEYVRRFGPLDPASTETLRAYRLARLAAVARLPRERRDGPTLAFLEASELDGALTAAAELLEPGELAAIDAAVRHFAPRYREIWNEGARMRRFARRSGEDRLRRDLARFLVRAAAFYGVSPDGASPPPRLVLVPVPAGGGTHAQAIGRHLLVEIRPRDTLADQVPPIVHENAHFLFYRVEPERRAALERLAAGIDGGREAWRLLHEALPTALAQGVAGQRFLGPRWNPRGPWYHVAEIDRYARRLHPLVREALEDGARLDETFVRLAVDLRTADDGPATDGAATPRSP